MTTIMTLLTIVAPSAPTQTASSSPSPSPSPSPPPRANKALDELSRIPAPAWAGIIILILGLLAVGALSLCFWHVRKKAKMDEEARIAADTDPQSVLARAWVRDMAAGKPTRPLPILLRRVPPPEGQDPPPEPTEADLQCGDIQFLLPPLDAARTPVVNEHERPKTI
ncbi:unnamed protein product [Penicillium bialowiezense]